MSYPTGMVIVFSRHLTWFSFSRVSAYLAGTRPRPLGVLSEVCSGFSRFKQPRGISLGSALPLSTFEVPCLVQPRLHFCLLPGLAPLGVMSEVRSGSSRLKQSRDTFLGSALPVLLFLKKSIRLPSSGSRIGLLFR